MKRCLIAERTCPKQLNICCQECEEPCAAKCNSFGCTAYIELDTQMVAFENKYLEVIKQIVATEIAAKKINDQKDEMREQLLSLMQQNGVKKFENEAISMTFVDEHVMTKFDSKALKELDPETYDKYLTSTVVKPSIKIKVK